MANQKDLSLVNETFATIYKRHSIRLFKDTPVSDPDIEMIMQAANQAPSAHNQQSWRFIVVRGQMKETLGNLVNAKAADFPRPASALLRMASRSIASAPVVIAVANTGDLINHGTDLFQISKDSAYDFFRTMEIQSSAAAVQNLLLAATSLGLSTVWLGVLFLIKNEVLQLLGEPKGEFMAVIPVGYAAKESHGPRKQPLEMVVKNF